MRKSDRVFLFAPPASWREMAFFFLWNEELEGIVDFVSLVSVTRLIYISNEQFKN